MSEAVKPRWKLYDWAIRYKSVPEADFALFTAQEDAEAFLVLLKLTDGDLYEIVEVER